MPFINNYPWFPFVQNVDVTDRSVTIRSVIPLDTAVNRALAMRHGPITSYHNCDGMLTEHQRHKQVVFVLAALSATDFPRHHQLKNIGGILSWTNYQIVPHLDDIEINFLFEGEERCRLVFSSDCNHLTFHGCSSGYSKTFAVDNRGLASLLDFLDTEYRNIAGLIGLNQL